MKATATLFLHQVLRPTQSMLSIPTEVALGSALLLCLYYSKFLSGE